MGVNIFDSLLFLWFSYLDSRLMSLRTQLLIPTKGPKKADYLYIGHQQGILLQLKKEKET